MRRWALVLGVTAALAVAAVSLIPGLKMAFYAALTEQTSATALTPDEAHSQALTGAITLVDIRRPDEWRATGIAASAVPLDMRRDDFLAVLDSQVGGDRGAPIAVICARGVRSARLSNILTEAGFDNIIDVPEGMLGSAAGPGWLQRGLPVTQPEA